MTTPLGGGPVRDQSQAALGAGRQDDVTASQAGSSPGATLRPPANRVSSRAVRFWTVHAVLKWVPVTAAQVIWWIADHQHTGWHWAAAVATVILLATNVVIEPQWRYRVHRWESTRTAVYTQAGWFRVERRIAPMTRIQTVDIERGPIEQIFKLANVTVTTASAAGPLKIHGLDRPVAEQLVHDLTEATENSQDDAT